MKFILWKKQKNQNLNLDKIILSFEVISIFEFEYKFDLVGFIWFFKGFNYSKPFTLKSETPKDVINTL